MAHLVAMGLPLLLFLAVEARGRLRFIVAAAGVAIAAAALVLSRSRAAWLGTGLGATFLVIEGLWIGRLWADDRLRRRVLQLTGVGLGWRSLAIVLPNRLNWRSDSPYLDSLTGVTNYKEGSGRGRLIQYGNTLDMAAHHPSSAWVPATGRCSIRGSCRRAIPSFDADDFIPTNPWPSSDWMAIASERGFPALALLALHGHLHRARRVGPPAPPSGGRPGAHRRDDRGTLSSLAVVGAFDAVLLLPIPTLFAWTIVGALRPSRVPIREIILTSAPGGGRSAWRRCWGCCSWARGWHARRRSGSTTAAIRARWSWLADRSRQLPHPHAARRRVAQIG